jgi:hypothetical protein
VGESDQHWRIVNEKGCSIETRIERLRIPQHHHCPSRSSGYLLSFEVMMVKEEETMTSGGDRWSSSERLVCANLTKTRLLRQLLMHLLAKRWSDSKRECLGRLVEGNVQ